jgi:hypothetical protein
MRAQNAANTQMKQGDGDQEMSGGRYVGGSGTGYNNMNDSDEEDSEEDVYN